MEKGADEIFKVFKEWIDVGKEKELLTIISYLDDFEDADTFKKLVEVLLRLGALNSVWIDLTKQMVYVKWQQNCSKYFKDDKNLHRQFLIEIFENEKIEIFARTSLANNFLKGIIEGIIDEKELFISHEDLRNLIYEKFDKYLLSNPVNPGKTLGIYYLNDYKVLNGIIVFFPNASSRFKNYLLSNDDGFKGYVKLLLRPSQWPYNGTLVLEPWINSGKSF
jgi:hypothetical protein